MENKAIYEFIQGINRGPFKCLKDCQDKEASQYVEEQNKKGGDIYDCAAYQAWLDMCRTVGGGSGSKKKKNAKAPKKTADVIRESFKEEPWKKAEAFDAWFESICSRLVNDNKLTFGQAQKLMNMTFKYLYCCKDLRDQYEKHFAFCHMPLDGLTLEWYKNTDNAKAYNGEKWSKITDQKMYQSIQNQIRKELNQKDILLEEFSIWQKMKEEMDRKTIIASAKRIQNYQGCPEELKSALDDFIKTEEKACADLE